MKALFGGKKKAAGGFAISAPTGPVVHKVHVGTDFSWSSADDPTNLFILDRQLGEGACGVVYLGIHKESNFELAIKIVVTPGDKVQKEVEKEIQVLRECSHVNIVRYFGCMMEGKKLWIMMDYCGAGSVEALVAKVPGNHLSEEQMRVILASCLQGLAYLHSKGIIHRDIKGGNILITSEGVIKLADFGVSAVLGDVQGLAQTTVGTPLWMSPEVLSGNPYNSKADIWSIGITCLEMGEGEAPYKEESLMRAMYIIASEPPPRLKDESAWSPEFVQFVYACLQRAVDARPSAAECSMSPFLADCKPETCFDVVKGMLAAAGIVTHTASMNATIMSKTAALDAMRASAYTADAIDQKGDVSPLSTSSFAGGVAGEGASPGGGGGGAASAPTARKKKDPSGRSKSEKKMEGPHSARGKERAKQDKRTSLSAPASAKTLEIEQLHKTIEDLQRELREAQQELVLLRSKQPGGSGDAAITMMRQLMEENERLRQENERLRADPSDSVLSASPMTSPNSTTEGILI
eukprot:CAMPEP_0177632248 /NCGR_PEP_ID=MMETSP0447-20121125/2186_1 /TAXON_ID=0 /ORGANISM="Stygamoeba regulata, Strain BSH-02190019" /LENGTH=520 /DNA_ID=CAMNT_0019133795 /DNA_START=116 /DNA_END=1678 /DNA_ORIENTATION=-